ncbi:proton extrusion protein PcxA [cyanobacterium endosymbiont of Epithemia turgida]|uniref:proton extrusion protein PcxA n=1 Tax=cyanobacterium endosymbiont of Epithemia turgida TaxID=718217 RepID=UPI0004D15083|nr:proton extrusion protein PcxA [cyanobacterium endosymbiont of Epithemia turgida]BAP18609.1 proton extrusion protein PcxA [cyanobacterium endosymbiont of Epithemia turgida isolate EtSB Lake Yunoko]
MKLKSFIQNTSDWFFAIPEKSLSSAYKSALKIKEIENKHFGGKKVSVENSNYGTSIITYFETEVNGYLQKINTGLAFFKASRFFLKISDLQDKQLHLRDQRDYQDQETNTSVIFDKLEFIDEVTNHYQTPNINPEVEVENKTVAPGEKINPNQLSSTNNENFSKFRNTSVSQKKNNDNSNLASASKKIGVLPRSFINTLNRIKQEIDPKSGETEEEVLVKYRKSRYRTALSIKFILLLIIVPLLTHQLTKTFFLTPIVERYFTSHQQVIFINRDLEEEALNELQHYEETLRFRVLIGLGPEFSPEKIREKIKHKAEEITDEYRHQGVDSIANIFADIFSFVSFFVVIVTSKKEIEVVRSFLDEILYGLSDPAKAFLIILFTDMFVGFHSPHGWEVILQGVSRHFGLPENQEFNFLFIATFPVILDTVLKYWIFRYLNRISPSAVATYKNMNE